MRILLDQAAATIQAMTRENEELRWQAEDPMERLKRLEHEPSTPERAAVVLAPHFPKSLGTGEQHQRFEDDSPDGWIAVTIGNDSDCHLTVLDVQRQCMASARFRTYFGGGRSTRTRQALLWLAEAIRQDNLESPQHRLRGE